MADPAEENVVEEGPDSRADEIQAYSFLKVFADDDRIEQGEFDMLERLALKDQIVDQEEREVLALIFDKIGPGDVDPGVWQEIQDFRTKYEI